MAPVQRKGLRALQIWCGQVTSEYPNVNVTDLSTSFRDGLAFNAIIHHFRPDLFDYNALDAADIRENNAHAFRVAEEALNIPALLDPEDMVDCEVPDKQSVATYLAQLYHLFKTASPPTSPPVRTSLTRLSSSEGENDSLLSSSSTSDSPPSLRSSTSSSSSAASPAIAPAAPAPTFNRSELIAKYGEDIFSCSSPPSTQRSMTSSSTQKSNTMTSPVNATTPVVLKKQESVSLVTTSTPKAFGSPSSYHSFRSSPSATSVQPPSFNRSDLMAKYGADIFSSGSSPTSSPPRSSSKPGSPHATSSSAMAATPRTFGRSVSSGGGSGNGLATGAPPKLMSQSSAPEPSAVSQKKNEPSAVASVRKQFEQFAKISAS